MQARGRPSRPTAAAAGGSQVGPAAHRVRRAREGVRQRPGQRAAAGAAAGTRGCGPAAGSAAGRAPTRQWSSGTRCWPRWCSTSCAAGEEWRELGRGAAVGSCAGLVAAAPRRGAGAWASARGAGSKRRAPHLGDQRQLPVQVHSTWLTTTATATASAICGRAGGAKRGVSQRTGGWRERRRRRRRRRRGLRWLLPPLQQHLWAVPGHGGRAAQALQRAAAAGAGAAAERRAAAENLEHLLVVAHTA